METDDGPKYSLDDAEEDEEYEQHRYIPLKQRKAAELQRIARMRQRGADQKGSDDQAIKSSKQANDIGGAEQQEDDEATGQSGVVQRSKQILLKEARELRERQAKEEKTEEEKRTEEERKILEAHAARRKLASDMELAKGISYTQPLKTSWRPPAFIRNRTEEENVAVREKHQVLADGADIPPLIDNFRVSGGRRLRLLTLRLT